MVLLFLDIFVLLGLSRDRDRTNFAEMGFVFFPDFQDKFVQDKIFVKIRNTSFENCCSVSRKDSVC